MERTAIINRLRTIQGHLKGIEDMINQERPCQDILHQTHAVTKSMQKVEQLIVKNYLSECFPETDEDQQKQLIDLINLIQK